MNLLADLLDRYLNRNTQVFAPVWAIADPFLLTTPTTRAMNARMLPAYPADTAICLARYPLPSESFNMLNPPWLFQTIRNHYDPSRIPYPAPLKHKHANLAYTSLIIATWYLLVGACVRGPV